MYQLLNFLTTSEQLNQGNAQPVHLKKFIERLSSFFQALQSQIFSPAKGIFCLKDSTTEVQRALEGVVLLYKDRQKL